MNEYCDGICISTRRDRIYCGKWKMELEAEVATSIDSVKDQLGLMSHRLVDFDDHGFTYVALGGPDLWIDVDHCEDRTKKTRIVVHKERIDEQDVRSARDYLTRVYLQIAKDLAATKREQ